ncbi:MAG TPA: hypothetical protein VFK97_00400 [Candidatus Saccharimonadales bacterium]|nr:hypothetical protein [Candidatus Saccharimonadales bacterium]
MKLLKLSWVRLPAVAAALAVLLLVSGAHSAKAASGIVTGFNSKQVLQPGLIVALDNGQSGSVVAAPSNAEAAMYGVVVDPSDAPLTLNGTGQQVFVATSGIYRVLVSTINGVISPGDYISMSTLDGIGAKATPLQSAVLGRAESGFNGINNVISNSDGLAIGRIYVNIAVQKSPIATTGPVPQSLKRLAESAAGKPVSVIRIYAALIVFLITAISAVTILWSGIHSSLVSLGRNPLSRHSIMGGLYRVIAIGLAVFGIGLAGVYLLLKI